MAEFQRVNDSNGEAYVYIYIYIYIILPHLGVKFLKKVVQKFFGQMCSDKFFLNMLWV